MRRLTEAEESNWDALICTIPGADAHILQTHEWAQAKQQNGWRARAFVWDGAQGQLVAAAMLLERKAGFGPLQMKILYCPKGPVLNWQDEALVQHVLDDLQDYARREAAVFLKIDPDVPLGLGTPGEEDACELPQGKILEADLRARGWCFSSDQIQFRNSVILDLHPSEEELLAQMKQKTRYNIRLAARKGVLIRIGSVADLSLLYAMYAHTAVRDNFVIRHEGYYLSLWKLFLEAGMAQILIADYEGDPIAALILFYFNGTARYMYGMSIEAQRELMPNYLLQWEAIKSARALGCRIYDFWGAPERFDESDSMWGVYRFKQGFCGQTLRTIGAWDYAPRPWLYRAYTQTLPRLLNVLRRFGKAQNRKKVSHD